MTECQTKRLQDQVAELQERLAAAEDWADELHRVLEQTATIPEYDCPGDTPELCGWSCMLCRGNDEHKEDCILSEYPGKRKASELQEENARLRVALEKIAKQESGTGLGWYAGLAPEIARAALGDSL